MKLAVDARFIGKSGIGTYIENIVSCLLNDHPEHEYLLITDRKDFSCSQRNVEVLFCDVVPFSLKELIFFPVKKINECDCFFSPYINLPLGIKVPVYSTIHDVIFLDLPGLVSGMGRFVRKMFFWNAVRMSKTIFTVSNFSKGRIQHHFGYKKPIVVTYSAISTYIKAYQDIPQKKDDYFIYVGNVKKHKGLKVLVEAYNKAKKHGLTSKLYIVGDNMKFRSSDEEFNKTLEESDGVEFTGFVSNERLMQLISHAKALVLPSFYEGLGLPPMEALYLGTNAIISDIEVFKEIYKDLPVSFFKVGDAEALAEVMETHKNASVDVKFVREYVEKTYNFAIITQRILDAIMRDYR